MPKPVKFNEPFELRPSAVVARAGSPVTTPLALRVCAEVQGGVVAR